MVEAAAQTSETDSEAKNTKTEAKTRRARKPRKNATRVLTDEEAKAMAKACCARTLRKIAAQEKKLAARAEAVPKDEAAREAAEYDAWFRQKVKEALESAEFFTNEEVEAEAAVWRAQTRREVVEKVLAQVATGEVGEAAVPVDEPGSEEAQMAAEYNAWFRGLVQTGLDAVKAGKAFTAAHVEAAFGAACAQTGQEMLADAENRRVADEVGVGECSKS